MGVNYRISGKNIYLDSNIFIYLLEGYKEFVPVITQIFSQIDNGILKAITSELSLAELLAKPMMDNNFELQKIYDNTIQNSSMLEVVPISRDILVSAARLRTNSIKLPDAIHIATACANDCKVFFTNDKRLKSNDIDVVLISEIKDSTIFSG